MTAARLKRTGTSIAAVVAGYWLYALCAVPLIEPNVPKKHSTAAEAPFPVKVWPPPRLAGLFPPGSWELENPKVLVSRDGQVMLLIKDLPILADGRQIKNEIELKPCTVIFDSAARSPAGGQREARPIVLQAPGGATLEFDQPLNLSRAKIGRLIGGQLKGQITVHRAESHPGAGDDLRLVTRDVQITESLIWSPHEVDFRLGGNTVRGSDFQVQLTRPANRDAADSRNRMIGRIKSIELVHVDKVHIETAGGGLLPRGLSVFNNAESQAANGNGSHAPDKVPTPIEITCQGPFRFDPDQNVAWLEDHVDVLRLHPNGPSDQLTCELLEIHFDRSASEAEGTTRRANRAGFEARRLVASGHPIVVRAPSVGVQVRVERLEYDVKSGRLTLATEDKVMLDYGPNRIEAGHAQYELARPGRPGRLLASGEVRVDSPQLIVVTGRLEAWIRDEPPDTAPARDRVEQGGRLAAYDPLGQSATQADDPNAAQLDVTGDLVQIQIVRQGRTTSVEDVTITGNVRLAESGTAPREGLPLVVTGDFASLRRANSPEALVTVAGEPAQIAGRGINLAGGTIHLHRGANRLWIEGPGRMTLPVSRDLEGAPLRQPQSLAVAWEGGMQFDGLTVQFDRRVQIETDSQRAFAESLSVTLSGAVDFSQGQRPDEIDVRRIVLDNHVELENRTREAGTLVSIDRMSVPHLVVDMATGQLIATGPGRVTTVRRGDAFSGRGLPAPGGGFRPSDRAAGPTGEGRGLTYLSVDFQHEIAGNLRRRTVDFLQYVQAVYGPVADWSDQLSADSLGEQGLLLSCDRLTVAESGMATDGRRAMELEAYGNTWVEGTTFTARGERISYAAAKDLLILEGGRRGDAQLWRRSGVGEPASSLTARKIFYWPRSRKLKLEDAKSLGASWAAQ